MLGVEVLSLLETNLVTQLDVFGLANQYLFAGEWRCFLLHSFRRIDFSEFGGLVDKGLVSMYDVIHDDAFCVPNFFKAALTGSAGMLGPYLPRPRVNPA